MTRGSHAAGPRLDPPHRAAARYVALQHTMHRMPMRCSPRSLRRDPGMMLDHARWLRHADRTADAFASPAAIGRRRTGRRTGEISSPRSPDPTQPAGTPPAARWRCRQYLYARRPAATSHRSRNWMRSFLPASSRAAPAEDAPHGGNAASRPCRDVEGRAVPNRAHYWLGRAVAASGGDPKPGIQRAAAWPTTSYGQLAAHSRWATTPLALTRRITAARPAYTRDQVLAFTDVTGGAGRCHAGCME